MNNLLKTILTIVLLLFIFLGSSALYKSCKSDAETDETSLVEDSSDDEYDIFEDSEDEDDFFKSSDGSSESANTSEEEDDDDDDSPIDYSGIDDALEEPVKEEVVKERPAKKTTAKQQPKKTTSKPSPPKRVQYNKPTSTQSIIGDAKYLVIAGSYLVVENAEKMKSKLSKLGYDDVEIVVFDERKYHTVCATKSNDYDTAVRQSNALKRKGVDSYVHTRQQ